MNLTTYVIGAAGVLGVYSYVLYPLTVWTWARVRPHRGAPLTPESDWPTISITVPVYNEASQIRDLIESLLRLDYPADRRQVIIVSDASDDGTDEIVKEYAFAGVELARQPARRGKTAAENAARTLLRGEIVINTDASIRIAPDAIKPLVRRFRDPSVGVASGRDVSVAKVGDTNAGEAGYVGYEMWVREQETGVYGIVGASGCFYAIRPHLHQHVLPDALSRDFASSLVARQNGYRAVSVNEAVCYVPRTDSLQREYKRKVRTMTRGMETLFFERTLLNPLRYGAFSWMLFSHKVCRWLTPWALFACLIAMLLTPGNPVSIVGLGGAALLSVLGYIGWRWPSDRKAPRVFSVPAFLLAGNVAVLHASIKALRGELNPVWEPTRRETVAAAGPVKDAAGAVR